MQRWELLLPKEITVYCGLIMLGLIITPILGMPAQDSSKKLDSKQDKPNRDRAKTDRLPTTQNDREDLVWSQLAKIEYFRKGCKFDEFLSLTSKSCEKCEKYCNSGKNMTLCGPECKVYYAKIESKKLQDELADLNIDIKTLDEKQNEKPDLTVWVAFGILCVAVFILNAIMMVMITKWLERKQRNSMGKHGWKLPTQVTSDTSSDIPTDVSRTSTLTTSTMQVVEENQGEDLQEIQAKDGGITEVLISQHSGD